MSAIQMPERPERVVVYFQHGWPSFPDDEAHPITPDIAPLCVRYVRADLYAQAVAERDAANEEAELWRVRFSGAQKARDEGVECPACGAKAGEPCDGTISGGVHFGRALTTGALEAAERERDAAVARAEASERAMAQLSESAFKVADDEATMSFGFNGQGHQIRGSLDALRAMQTLLVQAYNLETKEIAAESAGEERTT